MHQGVNTHWKMQWDHLLLKHAEKLYHGPGSICSVSTCYFEKFVWFFLQYLIVCVCVRSGECCFVSFSHHPLELQRVGGEGVCDELGVHGWGYDLITEESVCVFCGSKHTVAPHPVYDCRYCLSSGISTPKVTLPSRFLIPLILITDILRNSSIFYFNMCSSSS